VMASDVKGPVDKIVAHLVAVPGDLRALVTECFVNMGDDGDILSTKYHYEMMEPICVAALGPRTPCAVCETENFPGVVCWECGALDGVPNE